MKEGLEKHFEGTVQEAQVAPPEAPTEEVIQEPVVEEQEPVQEQAVEEVVEEVIEELEEIEEVQDLTVQEPVAQVQLPENVEKLVNFLNDNPGSNMEDYIGLNKNYDDFDDKTILKEYYNKTKTHLDQDDISYLMNKKFDIDPEVLDEEEVRERKIALKEELSKAKHHLLSAKDKYYADLKANVGNVAKNEAAIARESEAKQHFQTETDKVFEGFKGFTFDLGEGNKKVRYKVENSEKLKDYQSDLNNVLEDYLEDGKLKDAGGYHKALFAAKNADKIAQLFYEQGKADAVKENAQDSKNLDFSHTHRSPDSTTKLKPGQAREITPDQSSVGKVNLKYWGK